MKITKVDGFLPINPSAAFELFLFKYKGIDVPLVKDFHLLSQCPRGRGRPLQRHLKSLQFVERSRRKESWKMMILSFPKGSDMIYREINFIWRVRMMREVYFDIDPLI
jgi:hypothetical protein